MASKTKTLQPWLRIIDANFNRAKEALRVAEDLVRFFTDDSDLTGQYKRYRHLLTEVLIKFPVKYTSLVRARDSVRDVGRESWIQDGARKPEVQDLLVANLKRAQEAVRVLEELAKVITPMEVRALQKLRFGIYELEKRSLRKF